MIDHYKWNGPANVDSFRQYRVALLHLDGTDGSTTFTDVDGNVWTAHGSAQIDTAQSKFGGASALFNGSGAYIQTPSAPKFEANLDFCFEGFIRLAGSIGSANKCIAHKRPAGAGNAAGWTFFVQGTSGRIAVAAWNTAHTTLISCPGTNALSSGQWYHVAFSKVGTLWRVWLNGQLDGSATESGTYATSSEPLTVGRDTTDTSRDWNGWIDEVRITRGAGRYQENFLVPAQALPA